MSTTPTIDLVSVARELRAEIRERADEIEAARRLPADLSRRFARAGFYRSCVPAVLGGLETPPAELLRAIEILAEGDGSAAWCTMIGATSGSTLSLLPEASAREVLSSPDVMIAGVFAPRGRADRVSGGLRVNGQWPWGSGTVNAQWILAGCQIVRDGEVERLPGGALRSHMVLVPAAEVELLDTWYSSGLCGTGSTDFVMKDVIVPESRVVGLLVDRPLARPLYLFPLFGLLGIGIAGVTLGLARAAIDELVTLAKAKRPTGSSRSLAERSATQSAVAEAEAFLRSGRAFLYQSIDAAWQAALSGGRISIEHRRDLRLATTHAVRSSVRAVDLAYDLGGGTSVYRKSLLQRIFRDVHVATQHVMVGAGTLELTGRLFLGLETDTSQL